MLKLTDVVELYLNVLEEAGLDEAEKSFKMYLDGLIKIFSDEEDDKNHIENLFKGSLRYRILQNKKYEEGYCQ